MQASYVEIYNEHMLCILKNNQSNWKQTLYNNIENKKMTTIILQLRYNTNLL